MNQIGSYITNGFIERYLDQELLIASDFLKKDLIADETKRISRALVIVTVTGGYPRRLGGTASDAELALDKKRARRVCHVLRQSLLAWGKKDPTVQLDDLLNREGVQLEWAIFIPEHLTQVQSELRLVSTWAIRNNEHRWGRSAVVNLENEIRWLVYAMRD